MEHIVAAYYAATNAAADTTSNVWPNNIRPLQIIMTV